MRVCNPSRSEIKLEQAANRLCNVAMPSFQRVTLPYTVRAVEGTHGNGASAPYADARRAEQIREYLRQLLASPAFALSPRRSRLLEYLCQRALEGEGSNITEYALALDVFDKPSSFDPRIESTVRADVTRLRQKLREHYAADGANDPIVIGLSPRSYVPTFTFRDELPALSTAPPDPAVQAIAPGPRGQRLAVPLAAIALVVVVAVIASRGLAPEPPDPPALSLAVLPVAMARSASDLQEFRGPITEKLNGALLRTWGVSLIEWQEMAAFQGQNALQEVRSKLPAALILETTIERKNGILVASMTLWRRKDGGVAWSGTFPFQLDDKRHLNAAVDALAAASIHPLIENEADYLAFARSAETPRIPAPLKGVVDPVDPCSGGPLNLSSLFAKNAQINIAAQAINARSFDTRIPFQAGARQYPADTPLVVRAGTAVPIRLPALAQLETDTCVLTSYDGTAPVYPGACVVPLAPRSGVDINYLCAPKAYPIDLSRFANDQGLEKAELIPAGARMLDGIPFLLPEGKHRFWRGQTAAEGSARPVSLTIPVGRSAISTAYLLLNTEWGQPGPESYLALEFRGDRGAYFEKKLIGGVDVRDYHHGVFTNTVNGTTTRVAFDDGLGQQMDVVEVALPDDFRRQALESVTIKDTGRLVFQRAILWAVTVR